MPPIVCMCEPGHSIDIGHTESCMDRNALCIRIQLTNQLPVKVRWNNVIQHLSHHWELGLQHTLLSFLGLNCAI